MWLLPAPRDPQRPSKHARTIRNSKVYWTSISRVADSPSHLPIGRTEVTLRHGVLWETLFMPPQISISQLGPLRHRVLSEPLRVSHHTYSRVTQFNTTSIPRSGTTAGVYYKEGGQYTIQTSELYYLSSSPTTVKLRPLWLKVSHGRLHPREGSIRPDPFP